MHLEERNASSCTCFPELYQAGIGRNLGIDTAELALGLSSMQKAEYGENFPDILLFLNDCKVGPRETSGFGLLLQLTPELKEVDKSKNDLSVAVSSKCPACSVIQATGRKVSLKIYDGKREREKKKEGRAIQQRT